MSKIIVSTKDGEVTDIIDTTDYDLSKSLARQDVMDQVVRAVEIAQKLEGID